eukprot:419005-Lingulodinium_polyedra.AAC.1
MVALPTAQRMPRDSHNGGTRASPTRSRKPNPTSCRGPKFQPPPMTDWNGIACTLAPISARNY